MMGDRGHDRQKSTSTESPPTRAHKSTTTYRVLVAQPGPPAPPKISGVLATSDGHNSGVAFDVTVNDLASHAFDTLRDQIMDCAIFDTALPGFDTEQVLRRTADGARRTPVILVASSTRPLMKFVEHGQAADCIAYEELTSERIATSVMNACRLHRVEEQARAAEQRLTQETIYDALTKLGSRSHYFEHLDQAITVAARERKQMALLLMDLNRFREVNETLGHKVGDMLLEEVAGRLRGTFRASDLVARLGDDEFAVLLQTGAAPTGAVKAAGKLLGAMQEPFLVDDHQFLVGCSIGIALYPAHGQNAESLLRSAEIAMRTAKRNANGFVVYAGNDGEETQDQLTMAHDLRQAVENDQLELYYQPAVAMDSGRVCGAEALLRWHHPDHGMVPPDVFIPLAEQTGSIETLTAWVLDAALKQWRAWHEAGTDIRISVNLSPLTLHNTAFPDTVRNMLARWQVPADQLMLEITESAIVSDAVRAAETVSRLNGLGVQISIDDFGSGYSSLAYIRKLAIAELKVDKSYVFNMTRVNDDMVIVRTLIELAHNLGLQVVAEGVEDQETWDALAALGCEISQGFFMSRPLCATDFTAWLHDSPWGLGEDAPATAAQGS